MKFYLAPLEGITNYIYRNALFRMFPPMDKYFTPFLTPNQNRKLAARERNDILPEHNQGLFVVPQILTNQAEQFLWAAETLSEAGYEEINLNLGCPSGTVVAKHKGAGFLSQPDRLDRFLEAVFSHTQLRISIKTRIGKDSPDEFQKLLSIYNRYPLEELIIHPRIQTDFYKNKPNEEVFLEALHTSKNPVCYNGDIFNREDLENKKAAFPGLSCVMLGRGILKNPGLMHVLNGEPLPDKKKYKEFHDEIYREYKVILSGEKNVLFKMKEIWSSMLPLFTGYEGYEKRIKKAGSLLEYEGIISELFWQQDIRR